MSEKLKVGDYYKSGDKYMVVVGDGVVHEFSTLHNAMLYSRIMRSGKVSMGRLVYDLDYKSDSKNATKSI